LTSPPPDPKINPASRLLAAAKKLDFKQAAYQVTVERVARAEALRGL